MLIIAGGIIVAVVLMGIFGALPTGMFSGFAKNPFLECFTMIVFGTLLLMLTMCVFG